MNFSDLSGLVTIETAAILGVFVVGSVLAWRSGAGRIAALILAGLLSAPMAAIASSAWVLRDIIPSLSPLVVFVVLFALFAFLFDRLMRADISGGIAIPSAAIAGLAAVAGLSAIWAHSALLSGLHTLPSLMQPLFTEVYVFWWIVASLVALLILSR